MAIAQTAFRTSLACHRKEGLNSENAFISSLFTPFSIKSHRRSLYQKHYYDRLYLRDILTTYGNIRGVLLHCR